MSNEAMMFDKPVGVLARPIEDNAFGPTPMIRVKVVQNGFKISIMEQDFVAKTIDEAKELIGKKLEKLVKDLKKNDK